MPPVSKTDQGGKGEISGAYLPQPQPQPLLEPDFVLLLSLEFSGLDLLEAENLEELSLISLHDIVLYSLK